MKKLLFLPIVVIMLGILTLNSLSASAHRIPSKSAILSAVPHKFTRVTNLSTSKPMIGLQDGRIRSEHSPFRCLDADLNTMANNGTKVQLWNCNGSAQQSWFPFDNSAGLISIQSDHFPFRCLDADLNTMANNGTKVQLWDCNNSLQQSWTFITDGFGNWTYESDHYPYRCLDADLNTMANNGTKVQLWDCNGSAQQTWSS